MASKTCSISFDLEGRTPVDNVPISKIDKYMVQSGYYSNTGAIVRIVSKFSGRYSLFTQDVFACMTIKHDFIPIVLPYEFNSDVFEFEGVSIGDTISIEKAIFDNTVRDMSLEIAAEDGTFFYVSFYYFVLIFYNQF
tara:strand:+ start:159 stop:569 length:411 start_codon:yes stop_codon:yes gene_type:complete